MRVFFLTAEPPFPIKSGGTERASAFVTAFSMLAPVTILWPSWDKKKSTAVISNGSKQVGLPIGEISSLLIKALHLLFKEYSFGPSFFLVSWSTRTVASELRKQVSPGDTIFISQPWMIRAVPKNLEDVLVISDHHDIQSELLKSKRSNKFVLRSYCSLIQRKALKLSNIAIACTDKDAEQLRALSNADVKVVPNAVYRPQKRLRRKLGVNNKNVCLFVGSSHSPNIVAMQFLLDLSRIMTDTRFIIAGNVCDYAESYPENVSLLGYIENEDLDKLFRKVSVFVNPVIEGSGSNVKLAKAISFGVPIVTTQFGARGYPLVHRKSAMIVELEKFKEHILELIYSPSLCYEMSQNAIQALNGRLYWDECINLQDLFALRCPNTNTDEQSFYLMPRIVNYLK